MKDKNKKKRKPTTMVSLLKPTKKQLLDKAYEYSIHECLSNDDWEDSGQCTIILSRTQPDGLLLVCTFLIDLYCLGVRDAAFMPNITFTEYKYNLLQKYAKAMNTVECQIDQAHAIIYGALEYAENLGFQPHSDFKRVKHILLPKDSFKSLPYVEFGKDGKPFYISGPYDNVQFVLDTLNKNVGNGNYYFTLGEDYLF